MDTLHIYLKEYYAFENKQEYFKPVSINGEKRYINTFSISFDNCNSYEFNQYLTFIENNLNKLITIEVDSFDDLVVAFSQIENVITKKEISDEK